MSTRAQLHLDPARRLLEVHPEDEIAIDDPLLTHRSEHAVNSDDDARSSIPNPANTARTVSDDRDPGHQIRHLEQRLRFETLLSDLSARYINLPAEQVDQEIEGTLQRVVEFLRLDRSKVFQLSDDGTALVVTHYWMPMGLAPCTHQLTASELPWMFHKLLRGEAVCFATIDELPEEAADLKAILRKVGPRSNVTFPLSAGGGPVFGAVAFGTVGRERTWPTNLVQRLRLVAQVLANALLRKHSEQKLQWALTEIKHLRDRLQDENVYLRQEAGLLHHHDQIIGRSAAICRVLVQAEQVAKTDATVLLLGETGTGKELLATAIHNLSARRDRSMVRVNCAALPSTLIESELFGREKGAYTGALSKQNGRFELANGSTIFLDEVGDLPLDVQVKLLRVLQEGQLEHLGSPQSVRVNVRVIAASNLDLAQTVRDGRFREDLFYRLNVFPITVPPLRERVEDIPLLAWSFIEEFARTQGKTIQSVARESMDALCRYHWPGNIRELRNIIERAMITSCGPILRAALPEVSASPSGRNMALEVVEREHILHALNLTSWRIRGKNGAADLLRIKPTTLESRMTKLGIKRPG
jgi:transcriptional regulator with GAF, ATPase, and Fis domain